jgi:hypothetical protein
MNRIVFLIATLAAMIFFTNCDGLGSQGTGLVSSSGRSGEVLIVCPAKDWKGTLGDSLQAVLMQPVRILPQEEPMFLLSQIPEDRFREAFKKQRNIIYFTINPSIDQPKVVVNHNPWAQPQTLIRITAKDGQQAAETVSKYQDEIIGYLLQSEMKRFQRAQKSKQNFHISSEIERLYHVSMIIPEGFIFAVKDSTFCWLRKDSKDWTQNILIYTKDYTDTNQFKNEHIVKQRDIHTKKYVFGSIDSSYVAVDEEYIPTISAYTDFSGNYALRTVGLWKMEKDFMGGPFINMNILDTNRNRVVTVDAFLYAPADNKRDLLRQLEAVIFSAELKN